MHPAPVPTVRVEDLPDPVPDDLTLLDVREPVEWAHGHIEGALHVPMGEVPSRLGELPEGRILVVCHVGGRSARVTSYLVGLGHVQDEGVLMHARNTGRTDFGPGDRIGLSRLGQGRCF